MKCSIKRRNLPPAPPPTRPIIVKEVQGISHHLDVRPEKPPVIVETRKKPKRRTPSAAIAVSAQRRSEAKKQRKEEAIRLYKSGWTIKEIAEHMGLKTGAICDYTRDIREIQMRGERYAYDEKIIKMYNAGKTYEEIAKACGITRANVSTKLQRLRYHGQIGRRKVWITKRQA